MKVPLKRIDGGWEIYRGDTLVGSNSTVYLSECSGMSGMLRGWMVPNPMTKDTGDAEFQKSGRIVRW